MFELDQTSIVPLYKQLKDKIKDAILDGSLKPNQKIPSELELSQTYQISRITVRNAISELVDEELLEKKQGKGTFVCTPKIDVRSPNFTMMCVTNHKVPSSKIIKIVKQPASERDIRELNLVPDEEVIYLLRLLFNGKCNTLHRLLCTQDICNTETLSPKFTTALHQDLIDNIVL